jgi:alkylhydroperoxidase family enzyme
MGHMHHHPIHTIESAPEASRPGLQRLLQHIGLIPNAAGAMAESPTLINGFVGALLNLSTGTLTSGERQLLLLTNAVANRSEWPVAFHSTNALREGIADDEVRAVRDGRLPAAPRLAALSALTRALIEKRGHLADRDVAAFTEAGFAAAQVLEVLAVLACSVMANYASSIARPPLEDRFAAQRWSPR